MAGNSSDRRRDFDRMQARHWVEIERKRAELDRARKELDERMARLRSEMEAARQEFERALGRGADLPNAACKYRDRFGAWPELKGKKRRPRRGLEGGEPARVKPRPKPTPLVDGAEAPNE